MREMVVLLWRDSAQYPSNAWKSSDDEYSPMLLVSAGLLVHEDEKQIVMAMDWTEHRDETPWRNVCVVPRENVVWERRVEVTRETGAMRALPISVEGMGGPTMMEWTSAGLVTRDGVAQRDVSDSGEPVSSGRRESLCEKCGAPWHRCRCVLGFQSDQAGKMERACCAEHMATEALAAMYRAAVEPSNPEQWDRVVERARVVLDAAVKEEGARILEAAERGETATILEAAERGAIADMADVVDGLGQSIIQRRWWAAYGGIRGRAAETVQPEVETRHTTLRERFRGE